ncbi:MAG: hypothetical protein ACLUEK_08815 [Oscillospiraceae bacterium]
MKQNGGGGGIRGHRRGRARGEDAAPELPPFWDGPPELPKPPKAGQAAHPLHFVRPVICRLRWR